MILCTPPVIFFPLPERDPPAPANLTQTSVDLHYLRAQQVPHVYATGLLSWSLILLSFRQVDILDLSLLSSFFFRSPLLLRGAQDFLRQSLNGLSCVSSKSSP